MSTGRTLKHLSIGRARLRQAFSHRTLAAIEAAVSAAETGHRGELRFVAEAALEPGAVWRGQSPRDRALDVFSLMRVWDTEHNNGVLVYVLLADRSVEIVADRGIAARVPQSEWDAICATMRHAYARGEFESGSVAGVTAIGALLARHFPAASGGRNELPDAPTLM